MIIWDTGEYEILPYHEEPSGPETDDSRSNASSDLSDPRDQISDSEKLRQAFQNVCHHLVLLKHLEQLLNILSAKSAYDCMVLGYRPTILLF